MIKEFIWSNSDEEIMEQIESVYGLEEFYSYSKEEQEEIKEYTSAYNWSMYEYMMMDIRCDKFGTTSVNENMIDIVYIEKYKVKGEKTYSFGGQGDYCDVFMEDCFNEDNWLYVDEHNDLIQEVLYKDGVKRTWRIRALKKDKGIFEKEVKQIGLAAAARKCTRPLGNDFFNELHGFENAY